MRTIEGLRIDKGLSVPDMAKDLGVSIPTIYNWQKAQPDLSGTVIIKLCKYFKISSDELLGLKKVS